MVWVKYRINSRARLGDWRWVDIEVSADADVEKAVRYYMEEMISEEALHSSYGRSGDWEIEQPPIEVIKKQRDYHLKKAEWHTKKANQYMNDIARFSFWKDQYFECSQMLAVARKNNPDRIPYWEEAVKEALEQWSAEIGA